jgi:RNase P protein component
LARASEIELVKRTGKRVKTGVLDVRVAASPSSRAQVGVIVPKYKRTIVERNKLRRRLRELVRVRLLPVLERSDVEGSSTEGFSTEGSTEEHAIAQAAQAAQTPRAVLIRALPTAYSATFDGLARDVDTVVARIGHGIG